MSQQISFTDEQGHDLRVQTFDMKTGVSRAATPDDLRAAGWVPKEDRAQVGALPSAKVSVGDPASDVA